MTARVAFVGNPNTGKSTLFNAMTGGGAKVGNFAGTTVDRVEAPLDVDGLVVTAVDVPGTYSLAASAPEERIAVVELLGQGEQARPDALVVLVDATRLVRSLYLVLQLCELGVPMVVGLNFMDEARRSGRAPDPDALAVALGVPVCPLVGRTGEGVEQLRTALRRVLEQPSLGAPGPRHGWPDALRADAEAVFAALPPRWRAWGLGGAMWALLSADGAEPADELPTALIHERLEAAAAAGRDPVQEIIAARYAWLDATIPALSSGGIERERSERLDAVLLHPVAGSLVFVAVMSTLFMLLFSVADPMIGVIESAFAMCGGLVQAAFDAAVARGAPVGLLGDLVVQGLIGGVGSVLVFIPQIALLFASIALLEDSGYLARAAHLMDRILRTAGLPGSAFVPLLSGYACAVPAIMATRALPRARDRLLTMLVIPLTTCSARLPVYTLLIATLFPTNLPNLPLPLQPLMMAGLYFLGTVASLVAAAILGRWAIPAAAGAPVLELVPYRVPSLRVVVQSTWRNVHHFVREAGGVILIATIVLWALLTFPRVSDDELASASELAVLAEQGVDTDAWLAGQRLERTYGARLGQTIEPVLAPLGFDWKIGVGVIGAFAAREVFVSTMGIVYGVGGDVDENDTSLRERMLADRRPDGSPTYTPRVGLSLCVFFAFAMQCTSTLAALVKETGSFGWPMAVLAGMSALAWTSAALTYQVAGWLGMP